MVEVEDPLGAARGCVYLFLFWAMVLTFTLLGFAVFMP